MVLRPISTISSSERACNRIGGIPAYVQGAFIGSALGCRFFGCPFPRVIGDTFQKSCIPCVGDGRVDFRVPVGTGADPCFACDPHLFACLCDGAGSFSNSDVERSASIYPSSARLNPVLALTFASSSPRVVLHHLGGSPSISRLSCDSKSTPLGRCGLSLFSFCGNFGVIRLPFCLRTTSAIRCATQRY